MLALTFKAMCILQNMCVESRYDGLFEPPQTRRGSSRGGSAGAVDGDDGTSGSEEGNRPYGALAGGGGSANGGGADIGAGAAAGGAAFGGAHAGANAPPLFNPVEQPPVGGMAAFFDAWGETSNVAEHNKLRADLTAHVWHDCGDLLASYFS